MVPANETKLADFYMVAIVILRPILSQFIFWACYSGISGPEKCLLFHFCSFSIYVFIIYQLFHYVKFFSFVVPLDFKNQKNVKSTVFVYKISKVSRIQIL